MPNALEVAEGALPLVPSLALHILLFTAACGLPLIAAVAQLLARTRKKVFLDKFAGQIAPLAPVLLVYLAAAFVGAGLALPQTGLDPVLSKTAPLHPFLAIGAGCALAAGLCLLIARARLKSAKVFQIALAFSAALASLELLFFLPPAIRLYFSPDAPAAPIGDVQAATAALDAWLASSHFPPLFAQAVLLSVGAAGALAAAYVPMRRNRDDFGRDYYNFTLRHASRWAAAGLFLQLIPQAWHGYALWVSEPLRAMAEMWAWPLGLSFGGGLLAAALFLFILRSQTPMRQRLLPWLALLLLWLALCGQGVLLLTVFSPGQPLPPSF